MYKKIAVALISLGAFVPHGAEAKTTVQSCVSQYHHALTLIEARHCAPGAPEYATPPARDPGTVYILTRHVAVLGHTASKMTAHPASTCTAVWRSDSTWFSDGFSHGQISATGYFNQCGYANFPQPPTLSIGCFCSTANKQTGRTDSPWNVANYGMNAAMAWGNAQFSVPVFYDDWYCREYLDTRGNIYGFCS